MNKSNVLLVAILATFAAVSCNKKDEVKPINDAKITTTSGENLLVYEGTFQNVSKQASGQLKVFRGQGKYTYQLQDFKTSTGLDLFFYLATDGSTATHINLGTMPTTEGTFSFTSDTTVNLEVYRYGVIWCKEFSVNFGPAILSKAAANP